MRSIDYVLMAHFAMIRFDGASGACQHRGHPWAKDLTKYEGILRKNVFSSFATQLL